MGTLKGDVDILGLGNLLQTLAMNGREGVLSLQRGPEKKSIHFGPHGVRLFSTSMKRINRIGKILLRKGYMTAADLKRLLEEQKLLGFRIGQIAINEGRITRKDLEEALHEQLEEEIFDLFMWSEAAFEFVEGPPPKTSDTPLAEYTFDVNIIGLVLEASRRADELLEIRKLLSDDEAVVARTEKRLTAAELGAERKTVAAVLPLVDGRRTVHQIVQTSVYPRFATLRALYLLLSAGAIRVRSARSAAMASVGKPRNKPGRN